MRLSRSAVVVVGAAALLVAGCATDGKDTGGTDQATSAYAPAPAQSSASASSTAAAARDTLQLPDEDWAITGGLIATGCVKGASSRNPVVLDTVKGGWLPIPGSKPLKEDEEVGPVHCVITGDEKDPVVVYAETVKTRASGVSGESTRARMYAIKIRGGSADDAVDLTGTLTAGAEASSLHGYPGGFAVLESDIKNYGRGLKLYSLDHDLKPTVKTIIPVDESNSTNSVFPPHLSYEFPAFEKVTLDKPDTVMWGFHGFGKNLQNVPSIVRLPGGEPVELAAPARIERAVGRFMIYQADGDTFPKTKRQIMLRDTVSNRVVPTTFDSEGSTRAVAWDDLLMVRGCFVANMATGKVLLDKCDEKNLAENIMAGKYLYVYDNLKNPVIDLETGKTVSEGWKVRPVTRIPGWTVVAHTDGLGQDKPVLVRDNDKGEYPGPWW